MILIILQYMNVITSVR